MRIKKVLITGCSSGFGRLLVTGFLEQGWKVLATMRNADERSNLFNEEIQKYRDQLKILNFDVSSERDLKLIEQHLIEFENSELDCLINNAGFGVYGALEDISPEQVREQFDTNVLGLILTTRGMLKFLRASKGQIINSSSAFGYCVMPLTSLYCSSKYAIEGFSESMYYELKAFGVRVNLIEPGAFRTDFKSKTIWGEKSDWPGSPYYQQSQNYKMLSEKLMDSGGHPRVVVRAVLKAAGQKNPPLRIRCGRDAGLVYFAKRLVPEPIFRWMNAQVFHFIFNRKC